MNISRITLAAIAVLAFTSTSDARTYRVRGLTADLPAITCGQTGCSDAPAVEGRRAARSLHVVRGYRYARTTSHRADGAAPGGAGLVTVDTAAGIQITVSADFAGPAQAVIAAAVQHGMRFRRINCHSHARSHRRLSNHHGGNACDAYPAIPASIVRAAGLRSGCDFRDCHHFDNAKNVGGVAYWNGVKHRGGARHRSRLARMSALETVDLSARGWRWFAANRSGAGLCAGGRAVSVSMYRCTGRRTASGEPCRDGMFAASNMPDGWPMGATVSVTNPRTNRSITVRRNDTLPKGPSWRAGNRLDLMPSAFAALGPLGPGGRVESGWVCVGGSSGYADATR